jgi:hypothetical protein
MPTGIYVVAAMKNNLTSLLFFSKECVTPQKSDEITSFRHVDFSSLIKIAIKWLIAACLVVYMASAWSLNVIQAENSKPGTTNWQITNLKRDFEWRTQNPAVDPYPEIEGYASDTSVNRGGTIRFFVNTSESTFKLAIYRVGWYGGAGGRQVWPLTGSDVTLTGTRQPIPAINPSSGMAECNWTESYRVTVPNTTDKTDWASGVYLVKLTAGTSGKQSYISFVVRDDTSTSDYLFQSSVSTSQAYNPWGGKSLYTHNSTNNSAARKVSFNRPYAHEHTQPADYLYKTNGTRFGAGLFFEWEINLLRFLEREGYDVSYVTNLDVHTNGAQLRSHKAFLSVGHDEYWTYQMKSAIHSARANGVHLGFFAANEAYWQIRLEPSSTGQANRTIVGYKEAASCCDPYANDSDITNNKFITTRFRDLQPAFGVNDPIARPENELIGVMYHGDPYNGDITVSDATSWVYTGTGVTNGRTFPGLLGYETNSVFDNGYSPSGLRILADSYDPWGGSELTTYTAASGSITFATGSMQWNWGLDGYGNPCGAPCVNAAAQQVTRNVLARFVQPPPSALAVPQNVQATPGDGQISLSWNATSGATAYNVYRSTVAGGEGSTPYRTGVTSTTFTDTGLTNGTEYYYRISATSGTTESPLSSEVSATPVAATSQWTFCANEDGICTFQGTRRVRYGISGQYSILTRTSPVACNNATFGDPAFGADKTCEYETVSTPPAVPQNVQATPADGQISLSWNATSGATAYNVYRSTVAGGER